MNKTFRVFAAGALLMGFLTGCTVNQEEEAACVASGGTVVAERHPYKGESFGSSKSGRLHACVTPEGAIIEVYNDEISEQPSKWGRKNNRIVYDECTAIAGRTYKTTVTKPHGNTSRTVTRYVCVQDGRTVQFLK